MEAFEHVVKLFLEAEGYVVMGGAKFPVRRETRNGGTQEHGYEVDIVAARGDSLLLGSVKSFFKSEGVRRQGFRGIADEEQTTHYGSYRMFNEPDVRDGIVNGASRRYDFPLAQIRLALFAGRFRKSEEQMVRDHLEGMVVGGGPVRVVGPEEIATKLVELADRKTYINDPVVAALKLLRGTGLLYDRSSRFCGDASDFTIVHAGEPE